MFKTQLLLFAFALAIVSTPVLAQDGWGTLKGKLVVGKGDLPEIPVENVDKDQTTCLSDKSAPKDDKLIVSDKRELKNAFVMMYFKSSDKKPKVHPSYDELKKKKVTIDNKDCRFVPHAAFVRTGQTLELKNSDDVGHNCHIITFANEENINLAKNSAVEVTLKKNDKSPGNVVCDIHSKWMDAVILVRDEPYAAITKADGTFEIKNIPAGKWKFQLWHKQVGYLKKLDVNGYKVGKIRGEFEVEIKDGKVVDLGTMTLPASAIKKIK